MSCCTRNETGPTDLACSGRQVLSTLILGNPHPCPCLSHSLWSACCPSSEPSRSSCLLPPDSVHAVPSAQNTLTLVSPLTASSYIRYLSKYHLLKRSSLHWSQPSVVSSHWTLLISSPPPITAYILLFIDLLFFTRELQEKFTFFTIFSLLGKNICKASIRVPGRVGIM